MLFFDFYVVSRSLLFDWKKICACVSAIFKKKTIMFCVFYFFVDRNDRNFILRTYVFSIVYIRIRIFLSKRDLILGIRISYF